MKTNRVRNGVQTGLFILLLMTSIGIASANPGQEPGVPPHVKECQAPVTNTTEVRYFGEVNGDPEAICYVVSGHFLEFWNNNGGLQLFGYPISQPFAERMKDGTLMWVQYFERARMELHGPEGAQYVLLGHFGVEILNNRMGISTPPAASCEPQIFTHNPQPGEWWEVQGGVDVYRVVQFWTNWEHQDQSQLKLMMDPGNNQSLGGGGSLAVFTKDCHDSAQQWLQNSPGIPTTLTDLSNRGLVK
jgi:hypothetical protein